MQTIETTRSLRTERTDRTDRTVDEQVDAALAVFNGRSARLRADAATMHPLVAAAARRRAAELELAAWALAVRTGRPRSDHHPVVAAVA